MVGVCRYLSPIQPNTAWKRITQAEYDELRAAGIEVLLNWEYSATDWLGGSAMGRSHGQQAAAQAKALGHPAGRPIAGSADFDMTLAQWNAAGKGYATAFRDAVNAAGYAAGVYGPSDVLGWCQALGYTTFWQSMSTAFSGGRNGRQWSGTSIWQRRYATVGVQTVDYNDLIRSDWNGGGEMPQQFTLYQVDGHSWWYLSDGMTRRFVGDHAQLGNWTKNHGYPVANVDNPIVCSVQDLDTLAGPCTAGPDPATTGTLDDIRVTFASDVTLTADQLGQVTAAVGPAVRAELSKLGITVTVGS